MLIKKTEVRVVNGKREKRGERKGLGWIEDNDNERQKIRLING